jgi:cobalt-zinc-cadmium efflux system protein
MDEDHQHISHGHGLPHPGRAFAIGIALNLGFVGFEAVFGILSQSLALLSDAGHNLSDVIGLGIAWAACHVSRWQPTQKHTYGFRRSTVFAALLNSAILLMAIGAIVWEAIGRFAAPVPVQATAVMAVAALGMVINSATALLFMSGQRGDLNVRGAFLHMAADAAVSAGVVVAGLMISLTGIERIDPAVSIAIGIVVVFGTWSVLRESLNLALDAVPEHIDVAGVMAYLSGLPLVQDVHHVHVWGLSTTDVGLTAHLVLEQPATPNGLLERIGDDLHRHYGINHATIQLETVEDGVCLTRRCNLHSCRGGRDCSCLAAAR